MREQDVFVLADRALQRTVGQISPDQWSMTIPADFATTAAGPTTLREVVNYHAMEDAWVPDMLAGRTIDQVGAAAYAGDLLGDDPVSRFGHWVDQAIAAVEKIDDLQRTVHCSFGDFTTQQYLLQTNYFRGLRAYDIARVIGADTTLPDDLVQGLWDELQPVVDEWRTYGVVGPEVEVPEDAPLQDRLLGLTGRKP